jgi:hypothetical protein
MNIPIIGVAINSGCVKSEFFLHIKSDALANLHMPAKSESFPECQCLICTFVKIRIS